MSTYKKIKAAEAQQLVAENKAVFVDVRSPSEILGSEIDGSISMPFDLVSTKRIKDTVGSDKKVIFVCRVGHRASQAAEAVQNDLDVDVLEGGINEWSKQGLPVTGGRHVIPLDRQVLITVGILLLITVLLAITVSVDFIILAGLFGAGMLYAGITGSCGMAVLLMMMPWNKQPLSKCGKTSK